ncbi:hypothetical protein [Pseudoflavonifractor sp. 524-17]|nr:hypothetical protein [Pseudoflavonifractor sp. 524-17]
MSKKKGLKVILLALSVLLTAVQNSDEKEEPAKFYDNPDTHLE